MSQEDLLDLATVIETETQLFANTADRIGKMFKAIIVSMDSEMVEVPIQVLGYVNLTTDKLQYTPGAGSRLRALLPTVDKYTVIIWHFVADANTVLSFNTIRMIWLDNDIPDFSGDPAAYEMVLTYSNLLNKWVCGYTKYFPL